MTALTVLSLSRNGLTGTVPTELGLLRNLGQILLSSNSLTGPLPSQLGQLTMLTYIDLSKNKLGSSICSELGLLRSMNQLDLSSNLFTGTVPVSFCDFTRLKYFNLCVNNRNGCPYQGAVPSCLVCLVAAVLSIGTLPMYQRNATDSVTNVTAVPTINRAAASSDFTSILSTTNIIIVAVFGVMVLICVYCVTRRRIHCIRRDIHDDNTTIEQESMGSWLRFDNSTLTTNFTVR